MVKKIGRFQAVILHMLFGFLVSAVVAIAIFYYWYPQQFMHVGGFHALLMVIGINVGIGPLLTLVVFNPTKRVKLLKIDLAVIVIIQLACTLFVLDLIVKEKPIIQLLADDGIYIYASADFNANNMSIPPSGESVNLPVFAILDYPKDRGALGAIKFAADFMGEPYNLNSSRYRQPSSLTDEAFDEHVRFVWDGLNDAGKLTLDALPAEYNCIWLPVYSAHFDGYGCLHREKGIVKLARSL